ncbi:hypothetical protein YYC_04769 [Plasmodium yoelii 17X]|uniref:YIR protein n=1 Tax=Plasmodium yoelii 17X TaxID=1323249 RepID=V7PI43_PLAYE|nr:hypothetical protein YYC_04769 [Plasmodium yoelii 17X]
MAISKMCGKFDTFWKFFRDELKESKEYDFKNTFFNEYCHNNNCESDVNKINAGCLRLFNDMFSDYGSSFDSNTYKDEIVCIMIWLGYILSLKSHDRINTLNDFYSNHIQNNEEYSKHKINDQKYNNYKQIIDETKEYMDININDMSKLYELLKLLCKMNTGYASKNSSQISEHADKFFNKYKELFNDDNNIDNSTYSKVLLVLSNYYNNIEIGRHYNDISIKRPSLPTKKISKNVNVGDSKEIKTTESSNETGKSDIEMTTMSSNITLLGSSLINKLVIVLSIFGAIAILLGISYKYSLFGFRKRSQKQHLRENLKK